MITIDLSPDIISFGRLSLKWYSLAYLFGILLGWYFTNKNIKKTNLNLTKKDIEDLFLNYALLGVIIGGRIGYILFYNFSYYLNRPIEIFMLWKGGMSFHGGALGVIISLYIFSKIKKIPFKAVGDLACLVTPIGLFMGRIGNFINGELYGRPASYDFPLAVIFKRVDNIPRHPSQLYEACLEGLILFLILNFLWHKYEKIRNKEGFISGLFLAFYGLFRAFIEFFRTPDIQIGYILNNFTMGQILCLPMIIIGFFLIIQSKSNCKALN